MNKMKMVVALCACVIAGAVFAGPGGHGGGHGPAPRIHHAPPAPHGGHHHGGHHHDGFWGGVVGGVIGGLIGTTIVDPAPVVVTTPAVVATPVVVQPAPVVVQPAPTVVVQPATTVQNVWVEGRYVDQVQANGTVVRTWQPGHYEQRTVVVQ